MPRPDASELARALGRQAEAVCRRYLSAGRRKGHYWLVGDIRNNPGRSLFVRLTGPDTGKGAAGRWTDAATGEHGDLLDLIGQACGNHRFVDTVEEACRFLSLPCSESYRQPKPHAKPGSPDAARKLFASARPLAGTLAETYLHGRGLTALHGAAALRYHPTCRYHEDGQPLRRLPALIAAVTDRSGSITGMQRTWLAPDGHGKAPVDTPRRALGDLLGHAVRFGRVIDVLAAGEGLETMLSLRVCLPALPVAAALSATHLAGLLFPATLRRLYIARDDDAAGRKAAATLTARAEAAGIEAIALAPERQDFNDDLSALGRDTVRAGLRAQLAPEDVARFRHPGQ